MSSSSSSSTSSESFDNVSSSSSSSSSSELYSSSSSSSSSSSELYSSSSSSSSSSSELYSSSSSSSSEMYSSSSSSSHLDHNDNKTIPFIFEKEVVNPIWVLLPNGEDVYAGSGFDGAVLKTTDRFFWSRIFTADDINVTALYVKDNQLYIGTSPEGKIYIMDIAEGTTTLSQTLGASIVGFIEFKSALYVATSSPPEVYVFNKEDSRWDKFYTPYAIINGLLLFQERMTVLLEGENILYFDGEHWYLESLGDDNVRSQRRVSKEPFSHVSYTFINRSEIKETSNVASEDIYDIFPFNHASGIKRAVVDGGSLVLGSSNQARIYSYVFGEEEAITTTTTTTEPEVAITTTTPVGELTVELTTTMWAGGTHGHTATITEAQALSLFNVEEDLVTVTSTTILDHSHAVTVIFNGTAFEVTNITGNHGHAGVIL